MSEDNAGNAGGGAPQLDYEMALAAGIHDLRNRINHLLGAIEGLRRELADQPGASEPISRIAAIGAGISDELSAILQLYQVSRPEWAPVLEPCRISNLVEDAAALARGIAADRGLALEAATPCDAVIELEPLLVGQVLRGALDNALRFARGHVAISTRKAGAAIAIDVADDGPGYPDSGSNIDDKSQTGMGLVFAEAVARALATHGTPARVELGKSLQLGGAVFSLVLG